MPNRSVASHSLGASPQPLPPKLPLWASGVLFVSICLFCAWVSATEGPAKSKRWRRRFLPGSGLDHLGQASVLTFLGLGRQLGHSTLLSGLMSSPRSKLHTHTQGQCQGDQSPSLCHGPANVSHGNSSGFGSLSEKVYVLSVFFFLYLLKYEVFQGFRHRFKVLAAWEVEAGESQV